MTKIEVKFGVSWFMGSGFDNQLQFPTIDCERLLPSVSTCIYVPVSCQYLTNLRPDHYEIHFSPQIIDECNEHYNFSMTNLKCVNIRYNYIRKYQTIWQKI